MGVKETARISDPPGELSVWLIEGNPTYNPQSYNPEYVLDQVEEWLAENPAHEKTDFVTRWRNAFVEKRERELVLQRQRQQSEAERRQREADRQLAKWGLSLNKIENFCNALRLAGTPELQIAKALRDFILDRAKEEQQRGKATKRD